MCVREHMCFCGKNYVHVSLLSLSLSPRECMILVNFPSFCAHMKVWKEISCETSISESLSPFVLPMSCGIFHAGGKQIAYWGAKKIDKNRNWKWISLPRGYLDRHCAGFFFAKHGNNAGSSKKFKRRFVYVGKVSLYCRHRQDWKRIISTNTCCLVFIRVRAMRKRGAKKYGNDTTRSEGWKRGWRGDTKKSGKTLPSVVKCS